MAKSKFVKANEKIAEKVAGGYKKIEETVVGGYKKIEEGAVNGFTKIVKGKQIKGGTAGKRRSKNKENVSVKEQ